MLGNPLCEFSPFIVKGFLDLSQCLLEYSDLFEKPLVSHVQCNLHQDLLIFCFSTELNKSQLWPAAGLVDTPLR